MGEIRYLPVHVPEWLYEDILQNVAKRMQERGTSTEAPKQPTHGRTHAAATGMPEWTVDDLRRLRPLLVPQNKVALALLDLAAEKPEELVTYEEACAKAKLSQNQGRAHIGALSKNCKKIGHPNDWPVAAAWGEGGEGKQYYRMSKNTSNAWKQVLSELD